MQRFIDINRAIDEIKNTQDVLKLVDWAWMSEPVDNLDNVPAAFLYAGAESSSANQLQPCFRQKSAQQVVVLTAASPQGMSEARGQVWDALHGFSLGETPLEHVTGKTLGIRAGLQWYEDIFSTNLMRKAK